MKPLFKTLVLSTTLAASLVVSTAASAGDWRRHRNNDLAIGAAGLALGVIVGSAIASPPPPRYVERVPVYREPEPLYDDPYADDEEPVYRTRHIIVENRYARPAPTLRPWTEAWFRYCENRYRTFDERTGTYVGYDGEEHFCNAGG